MSWRVGTSAEPEDEGALRALVCEVAELVWVAWGVPKVVFHWLIDGISVSKLIERGQSKSDTATVNLLKNPRWIPAWRARQAEVVGQTMGCLGFRDRRDHIKRGSRQRLAAEGLHVGCSYRNRRRDRVPDKSRRVGLRKSRSKLLLLLVLVLVLLVLVLVLLDDLIDGLCPQGVGPETRRGRGRHSTSTGLLVRRTGLAGRRRGAAVWERRLQHKRLTDIGREGFAHSVNLPLHIRHGPRIHALLQDPHVSRKVFAGIGIEVGVRRCYRDLSS